MNNQHNCKSCGFGRKVSFGTYKGKPNIIIICTHLEKDNVRAGECPLD